MTPAPEVPPLPLLPGQTLAPRGWDEPAGPEDDDENDDGEES